MSYGHYGTSGTISFSSPHFFIIYGITMSVILDQGLSIHLAVIRANHWLNVHGLLMEGSKEHIWCQKLTGQLHEGQTPYPLHYHSDPLHL